MAMGTCRECQAPVSSEARACPKCGASHPTGKPISVVRILLWSLGGLLVFGIIADRASGPPSAADQEESQGLRRAGSTVRTLREAARNPSTFTLSRALATPSGNYCITYRAENGFGGMTSGRVIVTPSTVLLDDRAGFAESWDSACTIATSDVTDKVARRAD